MRALSVALALGLLLSAGCAGRTAPQVVAVSGDKLAQSIGAVQVTVTDLHKSLVLSTEQALVAQQALVRANTELGKLPPLLRAIDAGQTVDGTEIDQAIAVIQHVGDTLVVLGVGWPQRPEVQRALELARAAQRLVVTTAVELGKARRQ